MNKRMDLFTQVGDGILSFISDFVSSTKQDTTTKPIYNKEAYNPLRAPAHVKINRTINNENSFNRENPIWKAKERLVPTFTGTILDVVKRPEYREKMNYIRNQSNIYGPNGSRLWQLSPETRNEYAGSQVGRYLTGDSLTSRDRGQHIIVENFENFKNKQCYKSKMVVK